ncbi:MAG: cupin domain-containing protein [Desulfohalobiaceae bacterium]
MDKNRVDVQVLSRSSQSWDRKTLPEYPDGEPEIQILRITIPAGAKLPMHMHPVINAGVLLAGELTVITEQEKTLHLKAGDPIIEVVNTWHYGQNQGEEPAEIIVFYAGTKDLPVTINRDGF